MPIEATNWVEVASPAEGIFCESIVECEEFPDESVSCRAEAMTLQGNPSSVKIERIFTPSCEVTVAFQEEGEILSVFDRFIFTLTEEEYRACGAETVAVATELFLNQDIPFFPEDYTNCLGEILNNP